MTTFNNRKNQFEPPKQASIIRPRINRVIEQLQSLNPNNQYDNERFLSDLVRVLKIKSLVVGVGEYSSWTSFPYVDVVGLTNFTDPAFPLDYSFNVFNGSYFVIGGLVNQTSTDAAYAVGAYFNVTMDSFIPDEIIVAGADIEDADLTLMEMVEEEPV